jgi:hypothetical protein
MSDIPCSYDYNSSHTTINSCGSSTSTSVKAKSRFSFWLLLPAELQLKILSYSDLLTRHLHGLLPAYKLNNELTSSYIWRIILETNYNGNLNPYPFIGFPTNFTGLSNLVNTKDLYGRLCARFPYLAVSLRRYILTFPPKENTQTEKGMTIYLEHMSRKLFHIVLRHGDEWDDLLEVDGGVWGLKREDLVFVYLHGSHKVS